MRVDVLVLSVIANPVAVGYYRVALDLANVLSKLGNPIQNAILPVFVEIAQMRDWAKVKSLAFKTTYALFGIMIIPLIIVILFAPDLIQLFIGPDMERVALPFVILTIGIAINTSLIWARPLLVTKSKVSSANQAAIIGFILEIAFFGLLARPYKEVGVAIAKAIMYASTAVIGAWFAIKKDRTVEPVQDRYPV
jgi:O-antigen/teichoic acid export membrane protein